MQEKGGQVMEQVFFVLAIIGCGDTATECREVRTEPARYATEAQCRADLIPALARNTDLSYPEIAGNCRASSLRMAAAATPKKG
jgi:hypothetical protein